MAKVLLAMCLWVGLSRSSGFRTLKRQQLQNSNEVRRMEESSVEEMKVEDWPVPEEVKTWEEQEQQVPEEEEDWPVLAETEASEGEEEDWPVLEEAEAEAEASEEEEGWPVLAEAEALEEEEDWPVLVEVEASQTAGRRRRSMKLRPSPLECPYKTGGGAVSWRSFGGVNTGKRPMKVKSRAAAGDHEFVAIGGSKGGYKGNESVPWDKDCMKKEGFKLIVIKGPDDHKAELWYRKSKGGGNILIPGRAKDNPYTIFAVKGNLKMDKVKTAGLNSASEKAAKFKNPGGSGLTIGVFFIDDPFALDDARGGDILCRNWGYGDEDGFGVVLFQPGKKLPSKISITRKGCCGLGEYTTLTAVVPVR